MRKQFNFVHMIRYICPWAVWIAREAIFDPAKATICAPWTKYGSPPLLQTLLVISYKDRLIDLT